MRHLTKEELEAGLDAIRQAPANEGVLRLIVRRPKVNTREVLDVGELDLSDGLVGDSWKTRRDYRTPDGSPCLDAQLTLMNARAIALVAQEPQYWPLAGDQLYVDLDLSVANLPPGTQLAIGGAVIQITGTPHTGCKKFAARFGQDAVRFVNSVEGKRLRLRGVNARVVQPGEIHVGCMVKKHPPSV